MTETESLIERLRESAERESYIAVIDSQLETIDSLVKVEKKRDIEKFSDEIQDLLLMEIISRYYYQKGKLIVSLQNNPEVEEAKKVMLNQELYKSILNGTHTGSGCDKE